METAALHLVKVYVQRAGAAGVASVYINMNDDVAAAKEIIATKLHVVNPLDEVTLWKVDAAGGLAKLDDFRRVESQLEANDRVVVKVEVVHTTSA